MDLSKELLKINSKEENLEIVLDKLEKEKELADKKFHIFSVIQFVKKVKDMAPMLIKEGIVNLRVSAQNTDRAKASDYSIMTLRMDPHKEDFEETVNVRNEKQNFLPWFEQFLTLNDDFLMNVKMTESFTNPRSYQPKDINLQGNIEEQFYSVLLNKELKTVLEYNVLHLKLENKNKEKKVINVKPNKI